MQHYTFLIVSIILLSGSRFNTVTGLSLDKSKDWNSHRTLEIRQFSSTKERPELNSVLSELINEDVKKSIESKQQHINENISVTTFKPIILTTTTSSSTKSTQSLSITNLSKSINEGLIDQSIALDVAGSENNKQTSRIQTKKGPNGMDYEYEYIYYYYDDDDNDKSSTADGSSLNKKMPSASSSSSSLSSTNKSRYTTLDRTGTNVGSITPTTTTTTVLPQVNELKIGNQSKGRSSQILNDEQEEPQPPNNEERLPINTRFPPRSGGGSNNITPAISVDDMKKQQQLANGSGSGSGSSVKRPSLELVDSHSFNRDDKGNKNGRTFENEFDKKLSSSTTTTTTTTIQPSTINENDNVDSTSTTDITTPLMDKVAFDLYAILANANTDLTTVSLLDNNDIDNDGSSTIMTLNDDDNVDVDNVSTTELSYTTMSATTTSTTTTTTTSTTTEAPTTPTTTTTTELSITPVAGARKSPFGAAGRNRFRFRNNNADQSTVDTLTDKHNDTTTELIHHKSNRFSRPKSGFGSSGTRPKDTNIKEITSKQVISEQQSAPEAAAAAVSTSTFKGRNRGRPNLRASTTTTTSTTESTLLSNKGSSSLRARPSFQLRSRNRPASITAAVASTTSTTISKLDGINDNASGSLIENDEKFDTKSSALLLPTKPSRFAINRPNRLVGRVNNRPTILNAATTTSSDNSNDNASTNNDQKIKTDDLSSINQSLDNDSADGGGGGGIIEPSELQQNGLNRLKNRPRLHVNPNPTTTKSKSSVPIAARKINPLVARRKINGKTVTAAAAAAPVSETPSDEDENQSNEGKDIVTEALTGIQDESDVLSSEAPTSPTPPPRGLGLLGNRRRLPARRPGTIL